MLAEDDAESASDESGDELYGFDEEQFSYLGKGPAPTMSSQGSSFYEVKIRDEPNEPKDSCIVDQPWAGSLPWSCNDATQNVWLTVDGRMVDY